MKRLILPALLALACCASLPYRHLARYELPAIPSAVSIPLVSDRAIASAFSAASAQYHVPVLELAGIAYAESSMGHNLDHPNPNDRGWFGLHETAAIHAERVGKLGREYDPDDPAQACYVAAMILAENHRAFGDMDLAHAGYHQGTEGVRRNGVEWLHVEHVRAYVEGRT